MTYLNKRSGPFANSEAGAHNRKFCQTSAAVFSQRKLAYWMAAGVLSIAAVGVSYAASGLPPAQNSNGTEYVTGGFGENGADAFKQAESSFPLTLVFAEDAGGGSRPYVAEVKVVVKKADGEVVLEVPSAGPYLLAKLEPGTYTVEATYMGETKTQDVNITESQSSRHVMAWKTN